MKAIIPFLFAAATIVGAENPQKIPSDFRDVKYGSHERNVLDLWQAKSKHPVPLLIHIHGGGWLGGDKSALPANTLKFMLDHGISVASINYRYSTGSPLPAPVHDAALAVQFLRSKAKEWKLNKKRFAAIGTSAGACTSLWLAYHDDLADKKSKNPVARESTRLCAAVGIAGQTSIDPKVIVEWVGPQVMNHRMISHSVGAKDPNEVNARYSEWRELFREFSPINHVSRRDPPVMMLYTPAPLPAPDVGTAIHHSMFGTKLKEKADAAGLVCMLLVEKSLSEREKLHEFLLEHLKH